MAAKVPPPRDVADAFVKQYYTILGRFPEKAHMFYAESSLLGWPESDGVITPVTTLRAINDKILSSNYKNCFADVITVDAQASHNGGVFVAVTGSFLEKEEVTTIFFQTFFLARQEKGFFILNDILRVFDACGSGSYDAPTVQSDASDISVLEDTVAKVSSSASSVVSSEKAPSVAEPAANANDVAPTANVNVSPAVALGAKENVPSSIAPTAKESVPLAVAPAGKESVPSAAKESVPSSIAPTEKESVPLAVAPAGKESVPSAAKESVPSSIAPTAKESVPLVVAPTGKESVPSAVAPAANVDVEPVVTLASNVSPKITYANVVAKKTPVSSPRAAPATPRAAPVTPRASAPPLANGAPKASSPSLVNGAPKPLASVTKVATNSTTGGKSAPDTNARSEARAIYLGNLPYDVTKQRVAEVLRKFGPVRRYSNSVQLMKHPDDGFCCAFVEFESPDSARLAVEARNVKFGEKVAYITLKKSSYNRGSRSPTRGEYRNGNENQSDRVRAARRSPSSGQGAR